ncbi:MAG: hypothetical protein QOJ07_2996, partial [Thermoleophilaceae bacterium]|nr:hypothetical protein [Thermoleophilaceae bacterium]
MAEWRMAGRGPSRAACAYAGGAR